MKLTPTLIVGASAALVLTAFAARYFHWEDLHTYHTAGISLLNGRTDLYAADFADSRIMDYRYPPFFLVLFSVFSLLPYGAVKFIWLWFNIAAFWISARSTARELLFIAPTTARVSLILFVAFLTCAKYFLMLFQHFNAHLLVLSLMFGAFFLLLKKRWLPASGLLALAITFKVFPILTLVYFALKKQWKFLSATVVLIVAFNLLPAILFGADLNFQLLKDWHAHVLVDNEFHETNGPINLSLKGQLERVLTDIDYSKRVEDKEYAKINIAALEKSQVERIWMFSAAAIFGLTVWLIWFCQKSRKPTDFSEPVGTPEAFDRLVYWEFGLVICLMSLVAPRTNGYFLTALFFPMVPLTAALFREKSKFNSAVFCLVLTANVILPLLPGRFTARYFLVLGVDFYATLVLWLAMAYNLYRESFKARQDFSRIESENHHFD